MIPDNKTNFLYLADTLPKKHSIFYQEFEKILKRCNINFQLLLQTKDVWAVDYMPIQIEKNKFVQFVYRPSYLTSTIKWSKTISDVDSICRAIDIKPQKCSIILDGGNVTRTTDKVIMCDRVFSENPTIKEKDLIRELQNIFQVDHLIFIPTHPVDFTGHSDGIARFLDNNTVLINQYPNDKTKEKTDFALRLRMSLYNAGLDYIEIPYNPYNNDNEDYANGEYINFVQMQQAIIVPTFGMKEDDEVVKLFEQLFKGQIIETIDCNDLAYNGGILNCITWNIEAEK